MNTAYAAITNTAGNVADGTTGELAKFLEMIVTRIPLWIAAFIVIVLSFLVAKIARSMVENKMAESGMDEEHKEVQLLGGRLTYSGILILGVTIGLKIAGIDLTTIIAAVGFGVGFALKDLMMNFLAGIFILLSHHFTIGDFIDIGGTKGKVMEIQSRVTILKAFDGTKVIVPNGQIFTKQVTSYTSNPFRRVELIVGVEYRSNLENVIKVILTAMKETKGVLLSPEPAVIVDQFAESSIALKVRFWVQSKSSWVKTKSNVVMNIKNKLDEYGITIPWPIRTVVYDKDQKHEEKMMAEAPAKVAPTPVATPAPAPQNNGKLNPPNLTAVPQEATVEQPLRPLDERK
jgi:small conductance mechanosensitive channel